MSKNLFVTKQSGEGENFDIEKLKRSLLESGAKVADVEKVIKKIIAYAKPGINTSEIYRLAFRMLRSFGNPYAARYSLRRAIMQLGPSGFPFEKYLAGVLEAAGYKTYTNQIFQGRCLTHEIDVVAEKPQKNIHAIIEVKFHSHGGKKTGSKDALYTYARFLDINQAWVAKRKGGAKPQIGELQSWLVTNTKVTTNVIKYARCVGIKVISWDYPYNESLKNLIDSYCLYPITVLISLNQSQKSQLLRQGVVMCKELLKAQNIGILRRIGLNQKKMQLLASEINGLCSQSG